MIVLKVDVTADHIRYGSVGYCEECALALALKDATREPWSVTHRAILRGAPGEQRRYRVEHPLTCWLLQFDDCRPVGPITVYVVDAPVPEFDIHGFAFSPSLPVPR